MLNHTTLKFNKIKINKINNIKSIRRTYEKSIFNHLQTICLDNSRTIQCNVHISIHNRNSRRRFISRVILLFAVISFCKVIIVLLRVGRSVGVSDALAPSLSFLSFSSILLSLFKKSILLNPLIFSSILQITLFPELLKSHLCQYYFIIQALNSLIVLVYK